MPNLLDRLDDWKRRFGPPETGQLERLLRAVAKHQVRDAAGVMQELAECRKHYGDRYIRLSAFDSSHGWESVRISFLVNRPANEDGYRLVRQEGAGRNIRYTTTPYAADRPEGRRYP